MSLLAPLGLLLGLLGIPLTALYFLKVRRRRVRVPSTLLWAAQARAQRSATPFERFQRKLLLLVQLLILALLALALGRPVGEEQRGAGRAVVLVLDRTASMGALDGSPTRLDAARDQALELVGGLDLSDEAELITVGAAAVVEAPFTRDRAALEAALRQVEPSEAEGSLREGLELALALAQGRQGVEVHLFSDGGADEPLDTLPAGAAAIRLHPAGRASKNAAILALDLRASPTSELERQLFVTVQQFGQASQGEVELYLNGQLASVQARALPVDEPVSLVFALAGEAQGELRVVLRADGDLLPADDVAWAALSPARTRQVLLVGGDRLTAHALAQDPRVRLHTAPSADAATAAPYDATLFMGPVPPGMLGQSYAVLGPHPGAPALPIGEPRPTAALTWDRAHPLTRFVDWEPVVFGSASALDGTGGLVPVVQGLSGPLLLAGELGGGRVLELAFDPLRSDLPLRVGWPVFLYNAVGWLTERAGVSAEGEMIRAGTPWSTATTAQIATATGPGGEVPVVVERGLARVRDTERAGIYTVALGAQRRAFAANTLSPRESRIAPRTTLEIRAGEAAISPTGGSSRREWWRPLAWTALALLGVEWLVYHLRRRD
ncbi:MAG: VWA domain-containing protein [Deltaproteobacteria bacterium]|nr:VWA domain-containing protein [Deltaproteobacteria bacterium]